MSTSHEKHHGNAIRTNNYEFFSSIFFFFFRVGFTSRLFLRNFSEWAFRCARHVVVNVDDKFSTWDILDPRIFQIFFKSQIIS